MPLTDEQQREIIPELDQFAEEAKKIVKEIDYLQSRLDLYKDESLGKVYSAAAKLVGTLQSVNHALVQERADWVKDAITGWYRDLHYDMHPTIPIPEKDIADPEYESVLCKGNGTWEIIMSTLTHGQERIVLHGCNGVDWTSIYSADPIPEQAAIQSE